MKSTRLGSVVGAIGAAVLVVTVGCSKEPAAPQNPADTSKAPAVEPAAKAPAAPAEIDQVVTEAKKSVETSKAEATKAAKATVKKAQAPATEAPKPEAPAPAPAPAADVK